MNPYDFARIDWSKEPERRRPVWHHRVTAQQQLYTGHLDVTLYTETPFFIADPRSTSTDTRKAAQSIKNAQGEYIIPGSSLKGMLRDVVETLGNGCFTLFDGTYERNRVNYRREVPEPFQHCDKNTWLCIACRTFGMLKERTQGVFLGKVNIGDAVALNTSIKLYDPMYTLPLMEPKPHHAAFYLDEKKEHIAGRKYYFHHSPEREPLMARKLEFMGGRPANKYIQPLDYDVEFQVRIDFTNLEEDEFAALLLAIVLEKDMRHKLGYGKPLGLGSVSLKPTYLRLVDYAARYGQVGGGRGITDREGDALWSFIDEHIASFNKQYLVQIAMDDLRRIWKWPPDPNVDYYYPSKRDWFDTPESIGKRIAQTKNVP